jgi:hypothetical protein
MSRSVRRLRSSDQGMTTAEYAVGTVAACGFGGLLYTVLTSDAVQGLLEHAVKFAISHFIPGL